MIAPKYCDTVPNKAIQPTMDINVFGMHCPMMIQVLGPKKLMLSTFTTKMKTIFDKELMTMKQVPLEFTIGKVFVVAAASQLWAHPGYLENFLLPLVPSNAPKQRASFPLPFSMFLSTFSKF